MAETEYEYEPIEFYGLVRYDYAGQLGSVEVSVRSRTHVVACRDANETVADLFERAYEGAKTLLLTERVKGPKAKDEP